MQFPNPFKKDKPASDAPERIEPQIGGEAPAPWEVKPEAAPAFEVVGDERGEPSSASEAPAAEPVREEAPAPKPELPKLDARGMAPEPVKPAPKEAARESAAADEAPEAKTETKPARGFLRLGSKAEKEAEDEKNSTPTEAELLARQKTKYRLIGAAAIMMAVIVAAPIILDSEKEADKPAVSTAIPAVPSKAVTTLEPVKETASSGDVDVAKSTVQKSDSTAKANLANEVKQSRKPETAASAAKTEQTPAKAAEKKPAEKKAAEKKAPEKKTAEKKTEKKDTATKSAQKTDGIAPPKGKGFYVQVQATSSERKAEALVKQLASQGLPAYKTPVEKQGATIWRVRVGLYKTRDEARGVQGTIALGGFTGKTDIGAQ